MKVSYLTSQLYGKADVVIVSELCSCYLQNLWLQQIPNLLSFRNALLNMSQVMEA
jgi:hypothetical protein